MNHTIAIRDERPGDDAAIADVTVAAFRSVEVSNQTEHYIVDALRKAGALTISLVAEHNGRVVGHIAFSPVTMTDGTEGWFGLGPVSVFPDYQRQGIGGALIERGLERLKSQNAHGCCLVGHPEYYRRFGFRNVDGLGLEDVPPEAFFALSFDGKTPQGSVEFHKAFQAQGPQCEPVQE